MGCPSKRRSGWHWQLHWKILFLHKTTFYINMGIDNVAWTSKPLHEHAWSWSLTVQHMLLHAALSQAIKKLVTINHNRCQSRNQRQAESQRQRVNWKPASVTSLELRHKVAMIPASRAAWSHVSLQIESQTLSKTDLGKIHSWAKLLPSETTAKMPHIKLAMSVMHTLTLTPKTDSDSKSKNDSEHD